MLAYHGSNLQERGKDDLGSADLSLAKTANEPSEYSHFSHNVVETRLKVGGGGLRDGVW